MAEMLMDALGSANYAIVDDTHRLWTAGSITSMPAISVSTGSQSYLFASGVAFHELIATPEDALITSVSGTIQTAGSIYSIPSISTTELSVVKDGTETLGSSTIIGGMNNGSMFPARMDIGSYLMTAGSVSSMPRIGISGTDDIGSVVISSAPLIGVSGDIFDSGDLTGSFAQKGIGSIVIKSAPLIGISGAIFDSGDITGSVVISSSTRLGVSGIVEISSMPSVNVTEDSVAEFGKETLGSGTIVGGMSNGSMFPFIMALGSYALTAGSITSVPTTTVTATSLDIRDLNSTDDNIRIIGSSNIGSVVISSAPLIGVSGLIFTNGKMTGSMAMKGIGSMVISSSNLIGVSGTIFDSGDITGSINIATKLDTIGSFTSQSVTAPTDEFIQRIDYSGALNVPIYMGLAAPGTTVGAAGWQLKQLSYHTNSMISGILFGSGNLNFDKKWTERDDGGAEYS